MTTLFIPDAAPRSAVDVHRFVSNVLQEAAESCDPGFVEQLMDHKSGHGVRRSDPRYWDAAYDAPLSSVVAAIWARFDTPRILDVCAGAGTQSLLFAALGAEVIALDLDARQLEVLSVRLQRYSEAAERPLAVSVIRADAAMLPIKGPFDVIYSHAGWTAVTSAPHLFSRAKELQDPGGLLILKAANPRAIVMRLARAKINEPSPAMLRAAAHLHGYEVVDLRGTTALPRLVWARAGRAAATIDRVVGQRAWLWLHTSAIFKRSEQ